MLSGPKGLERFNKKIVNEFGNPCHYFEKILQNEQTAFKVHKVVVDEMASLFKHAECKDGKTALGDLLRVVKKKLLVVDLGTSTFVKGKTPDKNSRADARTLRMDLDDIIKKGKNEQAYWLPEGETSEDIPTLYTTPAVISATSERIFGDSTGLVNTDMSSLNVPILTTGGLRVG